MQFNFMWSFLILRNTDEGLLKGGDDYKDYQIVIMFVKVADVKCVILE